MALPAGFVLDPESAQASALPSGFVLDQEPTTPAPAGDYRAEAGRRGLAGTVGALAGVGNVASETLSGLGINPLDISARLASFFTGTQPPAQQAPVSSAQAYQAGRGAVRQPLMQAMGSTGAISGLANFLPRIVHRMVLEPTASSTVQDAQRVQTILDLLKPHSLMPALKSVMATLHNDNTWLRVRPPLVAMTPEAHAAFAQQVQQFNIDATRE